MRIRPTEPEDRDRLLAWANDPAARAAGFHIEPIPADVHAAWFARRLAEPDSGRIWIGLEGRRPIGVVRVDLSPEVRLIVSITIAPADRGRGYATGLLEAGLEAARQAFPGSRFRAWIRIGNAASIALFERAGFRPPASPLATPAGAEGDFIALERD